MSRKVNILQVEVLINIACDPFVCLDNILDFVFNKEVVRVDVLLDQALDF